MAEQGVYRLITQSIRSPNSTKGQIQVPIDTTPLLDLVTDCLHFVTEFFDVISQSSPHIYHSALQLVPQSSLIWKLYNQQVGSPVARIVTGAPSLWDSCTASLGDMAEDCAWSPCGNFIAVGSRKMVAICDSTTLEKLSIFESPEWGTRPESLAFSPDGTLLACIHEDFFG